MGDKLNGLFGSDDGDNTPVWVAGLIVFLWLYIVSLHKLFKGRTL